MTTTMWTCLCGHANGSHRSMCEKCLERHDDVVAVMPSAGSVHHVYEVIVPPPRWRSQQWRLIAGVVAAVAVVFGGLAVHAARETRPRPAAETARSTDAVGDTGASRAEFDRVVAELSRYVEQARGLSFTQTPKVTVLEDAPFEQRLAQGASAEAVSALSGRIATFKALGLIPKDFDPADEEDDSSGVLGFYDATTKELYVRGFGLSPHAKFVLVHELTHALQDQHFDLNRVDFSGGDVALGARSVIEGDAERVARGYMSTLSSFEQDVVQREAERMGDDMYAPDEFYLNFSSFPYIVGKSFANSLVEAGGQATLDSAFRQFPISSEQIMHPDRYLAGDRPETVARPAAGGPVVDQGTLGEYELIVILASAIDVDTAIDVGTMWGGSRYVTWTRGSTVCTTVRLVMEGPGASQMTAQALSAWASVNSGASSRGTELTSCR